MDLLPVLQSLESQLPELLRDGDGWQTVDIDYHPPRVERIWRYWEGYRINLHRIHHCQPQEPYLHPHPWPSAMHVLQGSYEMVRGFGPGTQAPTILGTTILSAGAYYSMQHPDEWHSVRPLAPVAYSIMLNGQPWNRAMPIAQKSEDLNALDDAVKREMLALFAAMLN